MVPRVGDGDPSFPVHPDKQTGRDVGITIRKATLRESINQARGYAGLESNMRLSCEEYETAAVETAEEAEGTKEKKTKTSRNPAKKETDHDEGFNYAALAKQVAAISSRMGKIKAGTRKPSSPRVLHMWQIRPLCA